ncbi:hypothetical protein [Candidatus Ichthyocystis sparus]|uniref:hypothetical protein n=1 Tax=Candidatus Ichthyocystis sparus TaxID=1561004 RepID=UPI0011470A53|nr:hypothetical protein [Candidatus Ichthyocystis sparus]
MDTSTHHDTMNEKNCLVVLQNVILARSACFVDCISAKTNRIISEIDTKTPKLFPATGFGSEV